jgi:very-short-patch-repair endonuclease
LRLVIELDGFTHLSEETTIKDKNKEKWLVENGFSVLRFRDMEVLNGSNAVLRIIENFILDFEERMGFDKEAI